VAHHLVEYRCRRIHDDVVLHQQVDEGLDFGAVEIQLSALAAVGRETDLLARIALVTHEEIQEHHVDVLDFVVATAHGLFGGHEGRHMAAEAHAVFVGTLGDGRHPARIDRAVKLDLHVAESCEIVDLGERFLDAADRVAVGVGPDLVNHRAAPGARPDDLAGIKLFDLLHQALVHASEVPYAGYAAGDVQHAVIEAVVAVHIP
jgi:hypothetical protein